MTFDIGLGEQHKLNCLQQRGTWKASWDGLGKYTEFYPAIGTIGSNTSKCDLCCQMKDILCLVGHFRLIVCSLHHLFPPPKIDCHRGTLVIPYVLPTQSVPTPPVDQPCEYFNPRILYCFFTSHQSGHERELKGIVLTDVSVNTLSYQCLAPTFLTYTASLFSPYFVKFEDYVERVHCSAVSLSKISHTVASLNTGINLMTTFETIYTQNKSIST